MAVFVAELLARPALAETFRTQAGTVEVVTVASGLEHPWGLAFLPDGRMLVTEKPGRIRIVAADGTISPPLAGVPKVYYETQGGLLAVAIDPAFAENRLVYWSYAEEGGGLAGTTVARGKLGNDRLENVEIIFRQQPKVRGGHHFGSRLVFARDGTLFVTLGERYQKERAQNLNEDLGKIVRINPDGSIPHDNPFVGREGARPEIYSLGHRNIQAATLHPETGRLWTAEHGARGGDEINIPEPGKNYGWPIITYGRDYTGLKIGEGTAKPGLEQPIYYWDPSIAPSGMVFYTADKLPGWQGNLFVGSLSFALLVRLDAKGTHVIERERLFEKMGERIRDVVQGPDGYLYIITDSPEGRVLRIQPANN
jgi:glucose/arabinose dehydrogenase